MVFNATFNNMSVISWRSVLLVEESEDFLILIPMPHSYKSGTVVIGIYTIKRKKIIVKHICMYI
jgi:hypothetical protein